MGERGCISSVWGMGDPTICFWIWLVGCVVEQPRPGHEMNDVIR